MDGERFTVDTRYAKFVTIPYQVTVLTSAFSALKGLFGIK